MNGDFSVYIHVPFCTKKCGYCHFFVLPFQEDSLGIYTDALEKEIKKFSPQYPKTIYFGGGTPSLLSPCAIQKILSWIPHDKKIEITLEANPESVTLEQMRGFYEAGITRISLGVQSLDDGHLRELTRGHDAWLAIHAIERVYQAGIENISIDLMYDLPSQTLASWKRTLNSLKDLPIKHLSLYNLTIEPQTAFYRKKREIEKRIPLPEESLAILEEAIFALNNLGLKRYEISAFAKDGFASVHNSGYWTGREFYGFGPSAFCYLKGRRARNVAHLKKYADLIQKGDSPIDFEETLPDEARTRELLAIGLRLVDGVDLRNFKISTDLSSCIDHLIHNEFLNTDRDRLFLTKKGQNFYDHVAEVLI